MWDVKKEIDFLFDFIRTQYYVDVEMRKRRPIHLSIFIDDLDRCDNSTVMDVLQASILLLVDAPITCLMAIDTRRIVTSINAHFGEEFTNAGLDGYRFLEKIIQLPFCLPDLTTESKKNYIFKILEGQALSSLQIFKRLKGIFEGLDGGKVSNVFKIADYSYVKTENHANSVLKDVLRKMNEENIFSNDERAREFEQITGVSSIEALEQCNSVRYLNGRGKAFERSI